MGPADGPDDGVEIQSRIHPMIHDLTRHRPCRRILSHSQFGHETGYRLVHLHHPRIRGRILPQPLDASLE
jgi:hypothetical protein